MWWIHLRSNITDSLSVWGETTSAATLLTPLSVWGETTSAATLLTPLVYVVNPPQQQHYWPCKSLWWIHLSSHNSFDLCGETTSATLQTLYMVNPPQQAETAVLLILYVMNPHTQQQHWWPSVWMHLTGNITDYMMNPPQQQYIRLYVVNPPQQQHHWPSVWWNQISSNITDSVRWIHLSSNSANFLYGASSSVAILPNLCKVNPPQQQHHWPSVWWNQISSNITDSVRWIHLSSNSANFLYGASSSVAILPNLCIIWWIHLSSNNANFLYGESTSATTVPTFCMVNPPQQQHY